MTVSDLDEERIEAFRAELRRLEVSPATVRAYVSAVRKFYESGAQLSKDALIEYKQHLVDRYRPKTVANRLTALNKYCMFIGRPECQVKNVRLQRSLTIENVITEDQYKRLVEGLKEDGNLRGYWMIVYLAGTGARVSEIVRFDKRVLSERKATLWTKGKNREILVPDFIIQKSKEYLLQVPGPLLFPNRYGKQMTTRGFAKDIERWGLRYGIPREVLHPHGFRHRFALNYLGQDGNNITALADLLGHRSLDTTRIYLTMSDDKLRRSVNGATEWIRSAAGD